MFYFNINELIFRKKDRYLHSEYMEQSACNSAKQLDDNLIVTLNSKCFYVIKLKYLHFQLLISM